MVLCCRLSSTASGPPRPDPTEHAGPLPEDHRPDPDDVADFELPDQQALMDAFMNGLCKTQCTTCWYPQGRLSDPDVVYRFRYTEDIREGFAEERKKMLLSDGQPRDRCKEKVFICIYYEWNIQ
jgi:hypothetical protein